MSAPVTMINEVLGVEMVGDRAIISIASFGAPIRLSLSRYDMTVLTHQARAVVRELYDAPEIDNVVRLPKRKRA